MTKLDNDIAEAQRKVKEQQATMKKKYVDYGKLSNDLFEMKMEVQVFECGQDEQEEAKSTKSGSSESLEDDWYAEEPNEKLAARSKFVERFNDKVRFEPALL